MLLQSPKPLDKVQIKKLSMPPEDWDGNFGNDSNNYSSDEDNSFQLPGHAPLSAKPIIKTEETTERWGSAGNLTTKTMPLGSIQMANLQECNSCKPKKVKLSVYGECL